MAKNCLYIQTAMDGVTPSLVQDYIMTCYSLQELGIPLSNQQERTVEMLLAPLQDPFANLHT